MIKELKRGQTLADARELMRGSKHDVGAGPDALHDAQGHRALTIVRDVSFFESETSLITPGGLRRLDIPLKSSVIGMVATPLRNGE